MNAQPNVIIVDDDPDVIEQLMLTLKDEPCRLHTAGSQQEAEDLLLTVKPDAAILDLMMEHKDSGFVLCHYIKKLYPETPVLMLTAVTAATGLSFGSTSSEARSWTKADRILDKPVRPEQLRSELRRMLGIPAAAEAGHH